MSFPGRRPIENRLSFRRLFQRATNQPFSTFQDWFPSIVPAFIVGDQRNDVEVPIYSGGARFVNVLPGQYATLTLLNPFVDCEVRSFSALWTGFHGVVTDNVETAIFTISSLTNAWTPWDITTPPPAAPPVFPPQMRLVIGPDGNFLSSSAQLTAGLASINAPLTITGNFYRANNWQNTRSTIQADVTHNFEPGLIVPAGGGLTISVWDLPGVGVGFTGYFAHLAIMWRELAS